MTDPLEDSLRQLLHRRAREVDTGPPVRPLDLTSRPTSGRVDRTWLAAVGSAAAVVAITVGAVVGLRALPGDGSPAAPQTSTTSHRAPVPPATATVVPLPVPAEPTPDGGDGAPTATPTTTTGTVTVPTPDLPAPFTGTAPEPAPTSGG